MDVQLQYNQLSAEFGSEEKKIFTVVSLLNPNSPLDPSLNSSFSPLSTVFNEQPVTSAKRKSEIIGLYFLVV